MVPGPLVPAAFKSCAVHPQREKLSLRDVSTDFNANILC